MRKPCNLFVLYSGMVLSSFLALKYPPTSKCVAGGYMHLAKAEWGDWPRELEVLLSQREFTLY